MKTVWCDIVDDDPCTKEVEAFVKGQVEEALRACSLLVEWQVRVCWHQTNRGTPFSWDGALETVTSRAYGIALVDHNLPEPEDGIAFIEQLRGRGYSGYTYIHSGSAKSVLEAIFDSNPTLLQQHGAGVVQKPPEPVYPLNKKVQVDLKGARELGLDPFRVADPKVFLENPTEAALCTLSAALPLGLLREARCSWPAAVEALSESLPGERDGADFEGLVRAYLCGKDVLVAIQAHPHGRALNGKHRGPNIVDALETLRKAATGDLKAWNAELTRLRNEWLSDAEEGMQG